MRMRASLAGVRVAGWGLLAATCSMGAILVGTTWSSYRSVTAASHALSRSQGDSLLRSLFALGLRTGERVEQAHVSRFLEEHAEQGLRFVAIHDHTDGVTVQSGSATGGEPERATGGEILMWKAGERQRLVSRPPAHLAGTPGPPPRRGWPSVTLEFEPLLAEQLSAGATRAFRSSAIATACLLLVAALFTRLLFQRQAAERRFEERRRLAALGAMSSVLAHEIRNPLASLLGHAQLLAERLPEGRERTKAERIVLEGRRLAVLTNDLLDFSRSGPIERRPVDPVELLRQVADALDPSRVSVVASDAPSVWPLDGKRMEHVLGNLLTNGLEASAAGTSVEATVAVRGGRLVFAIRDRGPGLPAGDERRIFEPFFTTRTSGTGLGLAVAQRVVELHGGSIRAANHPEGGAVFEVEVPRG